VRQLRLRHLGVTDYVTTWDAMRAFSEARDGDTVDDLWLTSHPPVFTQGRAGKAEHLLFPGDIPVVQSDRGGQVTYHGPGQVVAYPLVDLQRDGIGVRAFVTALEQAMIAVLAQHGIRAMARADAPGVYLADGHGEPLRDGAKIGSLGLRVRRGRTMHGLALNVDLDLEPFSRINPCGLVGVRVARMRDLVQGPLDVDAVGTEVAHALARELGLELVLPADGV
jgi:lipoyl(octanoyl) transferase